MDKHQCHLWGEPLTIPPITAEGVYLVNSPRAGGVYGLGREWGNRARSGWCIDQLSQASCRQKANLSHWIYHQNLKAGLLRPPEATFESRHEVLEWGWDANRLAAVPRLDPETVMVQYARTPSALDRRLYLLNELLLQQDLPMLQDERLRHRVYVDYSGFRAAAAAWETDLEEEEFWEHLEKEGWVRSRPMAAIGGRAEQMGVAFPAECTLDARMWVEEQLQELSSNEQVFVAMWFDECLKEEAYKEALSMALNGLATKQSGQMTIHTTPTNWTTGSWLTFASPASGRPTVGGRFHPHTTWPPRHE